MLYSLIKLPARLAINLYCRNIAVNNWEILREKGPMLIAANHPNSFLDAIILATLFKEPVYSLVRGDTFKNKFYASLLSSLNMLPVYRMSEGAENLEQNYDTFEKCKEIFKKNGIVLIFSEGRCINEWKLRPLKKGTARLAMSSWQEDIDLKVLPTGINYQSFTSFGKNVILNFGNEIGEPDMVNTNGYGNTINIFNAKLKDELDPLVVKAENADQQSLKQNLHLQQSIAKKILLFLPAVAGFATHALLYIPLQKISWNKAKHLDHYDSVLVGMLFLAYPFYLGLLALLTYAMLGGFWWIFVFFLLPFFAWSYVQIKNQF